MRNKISKILLVGVFLVGLSVLLYPTLSSTWNAHVQSGAVTDYQSVAAALTTDDSSAEFAKAEAYNLHLSRLKDPFDDPSAYQDYVNTLDVGGNGVIGWVSIKNIGVELPIYHGTSEAVLNVGIGHLEGSSLPIGGEGTHSVLTGHSGLPSAKLFTDLDKMQIGDTFTVNVLDRTLTYQVDNINIVEPWQVDSLYAVDGKDYCTLMTCTPYGINSHRLLVRGTRIENGEIVTTVVSGNARVIDPRRTAPFFAVPPLLALSAIFLIKYRKNDCKKGELEHA